MDAVLKEKAIILRQRGYTYTGINRVLKANIPKSTLCVWFKNIQLTKAQKLKLEENVSRKLKKSQIKAWRINKTRRTKYLKGLKNKNIYLLKNLDKNTQKLLLCILYLGEGGKSKGTQSLSLGSSNPNIIKLYFTLLRSCFEIDSSKFRIRIQCRADQDIKKLESYWKNVTKLPKNQFYPTYIDKRTIGKPTLHKDYKGVCATHYFDRSIQFELEFLANSVIKYLTKGR
jgi:hypothetical protein